MRTIFKYSLITFLALLLMILLALGSGYLWSFRLAESFPVPELATLIPGQGQELGKSVKVKIDIVIPVRFAIKKANVEAGKGSVLVGMPKVKRGKWLWSRQVWQVTSYIRPFRPGKIEPGVISIEFGGNYNAKRLPVSQIVLPGFTVEPFKLEPGAGLQLAGEIESVKKTKYSIWYWLLLLIPAVALGWFWWSRRVVRHKELSPWERALQALHSLRSMLMNREISQETGFIRLTDLVREYLELRFEIPASTRTTLEFLNDMNYGTSPLPEEQRQFLREFMTVADQVKFAKAQPDNEVLSDALAKAEILVENTRIRPEEELQGGAE